MTVRWQDNFNYFYNLLTDNVSTEYVGNCPQVNYWEKYEAHELMIDTQDMHFLFFQPELIDNNVNRLIIRPLHTNFEVTLIYSVPLEHSFNLRQPAQQEEERQAPLARVLPAEHKLQLHKALRI